MGGGVIVTGVGDTWTVTCGAGIGGEGGTVT